MASVVSKLALLLLALAACCASRPPCLVATSYRNDDFCDCQDGTDETTTTACAGKHASGVRFACHNGDGATHISHVLDGICDCCDGSDEPRGTCNDTCASRATALRETLHRRRNGLRDLLRDQMGGEDCVQGLQAEFLQVRQSYSYLVELLRKAEEQQDQPTAYKVYQQLGRLQGVYQALNTLSQDPGVHFGRRMALCPLRSQCFSAVSNERLFHGGCAEPISNDFNFTICPFRYVGQNRVPTAEEQEILVEIKRREGEPPQAESDGDAATAPLTPPSGLNPVLLGKWQDTNFTSLPLNYLQLPVGAQTRAHVYGDGEPCWNGPERTAVVFLRCGDRGITRIVENGKCTYEFDLEVVEACTDDELQEVESQLEKLEGDDEEY